MQELPPTHIVETPSRRRKMPSRRVFKAKVRKVAVRKKKRPTRSKLVKELDRVFSLWVRLSRADEHGMVVCYTSGIKVHWSKIQNGHYISRSVYSLRWSEDNCRPQSFAENIMKHGNPITYRENLVKELGELKVKFTEELRHTLFRPSDEWLQEKIAFYTEAVSNLSSNPAIS